MILCLLWFHAGVCSHESTVPAGLATLLLYFSWCCNIHSSMLQCVIEMCLLQETCAVFYSLFALNRLSQNMNLL